MPILSRFHAGDITVAAKEKQLGTPDVTSIQDESHRHRADIDSQVVMMRHGFMPVCAMASLRNSMKFP